MNTKSPIQTTPVLAWQQNPLIATDGYHLTMGYLIEPERALEPETHVLYARSGGPLVVSELSSVVKELISMRIDRETVAAAQAYWAAQNVPFATDAWLRLVALIEQNGLPISVRGVRDGEVVLPGNPIVSITAPAVLAAVIEPWLISRMMKSLQLATRFTKVAQAVNWDYQRVFEVGLRAATSIDDHSASVATLKRVGLAMTSAGSSGNVNSLPAGGSMGHRYTQRFASDYAAFTHAIQRMAEYRSSRGGTDNVSLSLLLDTRNTVESGIPAALRVIQENAELIKQNINLSVRLDSGDLEDQLQILIQSIKQQLAEPALWPAIIVESGLTASSIERLEQLAEDYRFPITKLFYGIGGYLTGKLDRDSISLVYKLADMNGQPVMKFADESARGKESYPGRVTLVERELQRGVRRLVAQDYESATLAQFGWQELFIDWVREGKWAGEQIGDRQLQTRIRQRWEQAGQAYVGDDKYPSGFPLRPQLSPITKRIVDWLREYRLDATGKEIPEISCPITPGGTDAKLKKLRQFRRQRLVASNAVTRTGKRIGQRG